jgi:CrcB protein
MLWLSIAVGGALGAMARHAINAAIPPRPGVLFPIGIFAVNLIGCFAIGLLAGLLEAERIRLGDLSRMFLVVGLLGGFTTFSSYSYDSYTLLRGGHAGLALMNIGGQVGFGLAALWLGYHAGTWRR